MQREIVVEAALVLAFVIKEVGDAPFPGHCDVCPEGTILRFVSFLRKSIEDLMQREIVIEPALILAFVQRKLVIPPFSSL